MPAELPPYRNPQLPIEQRVADFVPRLTLEEKIAQLTALDRVEPGLFDLMIGGSSAQVQTVPLEVLARVFMLWPASVLMVQSSTS